MPSTSSLGLGLIHHHCRRQIERLAHPREQDDLLAVSQVLARLRFPDPQLLALLGGKHVMIESPLIKEIQAEGKQESILDVLSARFDSVPEELARRVRAITSLKRLRELIRHAARCPDLDAFREYLLS